MINKQIRGLKSTPIALALMAGLLIVMGATFASASSSPDLSLCASKSTGALRYAAVCKSTENRMTFNVVGPAGAQGETGPIGQTGAKGEAGSKGETGASGVEQLDVRTISYLHGEDNPGYYNAFSSDSCLDGSPKTFVSNKYYLYCALDIPENKSAYVLNVTDDFTTTSGYGKKYYPVIVPQGCSSIKFALSERTTDTDFDVFNKLATGMPPLSFRVPVRPNFTYANERTAGLRLYPNSGPRCLILPTGPYNSEFQLGNSTWSIALTSQ